MTQEDPEYAEELRQVLTNWRRNELARMTRKQREAAPKLEVGTDEFVRIAWVLVHAFAGAHHVPKVCFGARWVSISVFGEMATTDGNLLTRLVVAAHEAAVRVSVGAGGPRLVQVRLHPRKHTPMIATNHPTMEAAILVRDRWYPCPVPIPEEE